MSDRFVSSRYRGQASTPMSSSVDRATRYADVINFSLGDPELTTDGRVIDAAMADAHRGHTHYTDTFGYPDLREEILRVYAEHEDPEMVTRLLDETGEALEAVQASIRT